MPGRGQAFGHVGRAQGLDQRGLGLVEGALMGLEGLLVELGLGVNQRLELGARHLEIGRGLAQIAARTP